MKMTKLFLTRPTLRGLVLALAITALSSFMARAVPYASGVTKTGDHVTFILNQAAQGLTVLTNGVSMAHSIDFSTPGTKSFDIPGATTYSIIVTGNTATAWTQISSDSLTQSKYYSPRGVTVDTNPKRSTFGRIIVAEGVGGAVAAGGRTTTDGLYIMSADQGDITGQGDTAYAGTINWTTGGNNSPFKISMNRNDPTGQDYTIYIGDWSDGHSGVWTADALNPSTAFNELLSNVNRSSAGLVTNLHGSIPCGPWVEGVDADRKMYTLDEDYNLGNIWQYDIGTTTSGYATAPTIRVPGYGKGLILNARADVVRVEDGSWWIAQYRSTDSTGTPALSHWADGGTTASWKSGASPVQLTNAYGSLDINTKQDLLVMGTIGAVIYVLNISDPANPTLLNTIAHSGTTIHDVAFDAAGNIYAVSSSSETLRIYSPGGQTVAITSSDGTSNSFQLLNLIPDVKVSATVDTTTEGSTAPGVFNITRKADDTSSPLTVNYVLTGTAANGVDYTNLTGSVVIPAGATNAEVYVQALDDTESETTETVILTLSTNANYVVKSPSSATVKIVDTDIPVLSVRISPSMYERVPTDYATLVIERNLGNTNVGIYLSDVASVLTTGGTAVSGTDYTLDTGALPLYLNNGARAVTNNVALLTTPVDNSILDMPSRTIVVGIVSGVDYVAATNLATCTIIDDEDPVETVIWSDNFNTDSSANYVVKFAATNTVQDYTASFNYDYSGYGVPAAPHSSGDTHGLMLNVNKNDTTLSAAGLNLYPSGRSFSGNFALRFDMYLVDGAVNNTEYAIFGINHAGTKTNWFRLGTGGYTNSSYDGVWGVVESDASGTDDYILFSSPQTTGATRTPTYRARAGAGAFKEIFKSPPFSVTGGAPANDNGSATPTWADVELAQVGTLVTLRINHTTVLQYNNTVAATSGNIMLGYDDAYDSIGDSLGVFYDNVRVVQLFPPTIVTQPTSAITPTGGSTNFTVVASGTTTGFTNYQWRFNGVAIAGATSATLALNNVQWANYGEYTVVVSDGVYSVTSVVANLTVVPSGIALGSGTGLMGGYWTLHTNTAPYTGSPTLVQTDSSVNFDWITGSPSSQISTDYFTARWVGEVQALSSGTDNYTFTTISDDGARLWVNGQLLVNSWIAQGTTPRPGTPIALTGTNKYDIILEYFEVTGNASAKLYWSNATTVGYSAVPQSQLYPAAGVVPAISLTAPANGSSYIAPATINLAANITAINKNLIQYVSFYRGATLIGSVTNAPYQYAWTAVPAGTYPITAAVVYNTNWLAFSAVTNSVTVTALVGPTISGISGNSLYYTNGAGSQFVLLKTANVLSSGTVWTREATNTASYGSFTIPVGSEARAFYTIKSE